MKRTDVINYVIERKGYKSYLELGVRIGKETFHKINCQTKFCVDIDPNAQPDFVGTTDEFFYSTEGAFEDFSYDLIFIDALHQYDQVKRDFENSLKILNEGGCIILHDALPHNVEYTKPGWCGDVWKVAFELSTKYDLRTFKDDHGCCVIFPEHTIDRTIQSSTLEERFDYSLLKTSINVVTELKDLIPREYSKFAPTTDSDVRNVSLSEFYEATDKMHKVQESTGPKVLREDKDFNKEIREIDHKINTETESLVSALNLTEIKKLYREKTGKKRVPATTTKEDMIKELS